MVERTDAHRDHTVSIEALGVAIDILVSGRLADEASSRIARAWSDALRLGGPCAATLRVHAGQASATADLFSEDLDLLLHHLSQLVTRVAIEQRAGDLMMLHAAGLADPATGATVALVAPSGTGKTTICRALGEEFAYVTDETVGFDTSLRVSPYRKPLSVVQAGHAYKEQVSPRELGLVASPQRLCLAAIVVLERITGFSGVDISDVRTAAALPVLAPETSYLGVHEHPLHFLADALEQTGGLRRVRYGAAADLAPLLRELLGAIR